MEKTDFYPIMYARVGSTLKNGRIFLSDVISGNVSKFKAGGTGSTSMSGRSHYVQSSEMNKGSFGVSGSYGISGISKVEASVGGYVGKAVADGSKSITVNYNAYISSGVEFLNVNGLTLIDLINAFDVNPKNKMLEIIANFNEVMNQVRDAPLEKIDAAIFEKWIKSVDEFQSSYGESMVVAVHWGAFGSVNMELSNMDGSQITNYGASGNFSYSNLVASVSVKATYDGNNANASANVNVNVSSHYTGDSIKSLIANWRAEAEGKSFSELANVQMLAKVPDLSVPSGIIPSIPAFVEPKEVPGVEAGNPVAKPVTKKVSEIKNLDGLKKFSLFNLFKKQKEKKDPIVNREMTISEFSKAIAKPLDTSSLDDLINKGEAIELDNFKTGGGSKAVRFAAIRENAAEEKAINQDTNFVPLGVLVCDWSQLFPWFAVGFDNRVDDLADATEVLNWRSMIQDFITLSMIYYRAEGLNFQTTLMGQLGNSFKQASSALQAKKPSQSYQANMSEAFNSLTPSAKSIYKIWVDNPVLRKGELGFGFLSSFGVGSGPNFKTGYASITGFENNGTVKNDHLEWDGTNTSAFAPFEKFCPIIMPDNKIYALTNVGVLEANEFGAIVSRGGTPIEFVIDPSGNALIAKSTSINAKLIPVPFTAARGITWKGGAMGCATLSSFSDLKEGIQSLKSQLSNRKSFSLSSDNFENITWKSTMGLSDLNAKSEYIGIIPQEKDLMKLFRLD